MALKPISWEPIAGRVSLSLGPLSYHKKEPIRIHACITVCICITQIWPHTGHSDSSLSPPEPPFLFLLPICNLPLLCRRLPPTAATRLSNRVFLQVRTHRGVRPIVGPHGNSSITQNTVLGASSFALNSQALPASSVACLTMGVALTT